MDSIIINGSIYLKKGPSIFNPDEELNEIIRDLEFEEAKENPDFSFHESLEQLKEIRNMAGTLTYSGVDDFWQIFTDGIMIEAHLIASVTDIIKKYSSVEEFNKDFISLLDFLKRAEFVGREFKREAPIYHKNSARKDTSFMWKIPKIIVLYRTDTHFLVKRIDYNGSERYSLIDSRYFSDKKYKLFGPVHEEYRDTAKVYSEILNQVAEEQRKTRGKN